MRALAVCAVLVVATPAFAQESQQDLAARIVREQEELRAKSVGQALGAPGRAFDRLDAAAHSVGETPAPAAAPSNVPAKSRKLPCGWIIAGAALVAAVFVFRLLWRIAGYAKN